MDIPKDKNLPDYDVGQCDDCGGHGCATCDNKGWLPVEHPKVRGCEFCGQPLEPSWVPVYCSNECAAADA